MHLIYLLPFMLIVKTNELDYKSFKELFMVESTQPGVPTPTDYKKNIFVIITNQKFDKTRDFLKKKGIEDRPADLDKKNQDEEIKRLF